MELSLRGAVLGVNRGEQPKKKTFRRMNVVLPHPSNKLPHPSDRFPKLDCVGRAKTEMTAPIIGGIVTVSQRAYRKRSVERDKLSPSLDQFSELDYSTPKKIHKPKTKRYVFGWCSTRLVPTPPFSATPLFLLKVNLRGVKYFVTHTAVEYAATRTVNRRGY